MRAAHVPKHLLSLRERATKYSKCSQMVARSGSITASAWQTPSDPPAEIETEPYSQPRSRQGYPLPQLRARPQQGPQAMTTGRKRKRMASTTDDDADHCNSSGFSDGGCLSHEMGDSIPERKDVSLAAALFAV